MANKKFNYAKYLVSSQENRSKLCFLCNKEILSKTFKNHLLTQKHQNLLRKEQNQGESDLDFISESEPEQVLCKFCNIAFSPMYYEIHMYNGKHEC